MAHKLSDLNHKKGLQDIWILDIKDFCKKSVSKANRLTFAVAPAVDPIFPLILVSLEHVWLKLLIVER